MPKVNFVKKARKDYPEHEIKKGESYYWWKFRFGGKYFSKIPPKREQLTQSGYFKSLYAIEDSISKLDSETLDTIEDLISGIISDVETLRDECQEKLDNMPECFRDSSTSGQLLQERVENLDNFRSELEGIDVSADFDSDQLKEKNLEELKKEKFDEIISEIQSCSVTY